MAVLVIATTIGMIGTALATWFVKDAEQHYNEVEQFDRQIAEMQKLLRNNKLLHK